MTDSLKDALRVVTPHLKPQLVSPEAISYINKIADILPAIPKISEAGFECRLGVDTPTADFLACITTSSGGRDILADCSAREPFPKEIFVNPIWSRIRDFCVHWADINSPFYEKVTNCWLEFDVDESPAKVPVPNFFFRPKGIQGKSVNSSDAFTCGLTNYSNQWVIEEALKLLFNGTLSSQVNQKVLACFNLLPVGGEVFQIGAMLPRKSESNVVRLCVKGLSKHQILEYMANIGWSSPLSELESMISTISELVDVIKLNFAVGNTVLPKLGLECYFKKQSTAEPNWKIFLDYLTSINLCLPNKMDALLSWSGYSYQQLNQDLWPVNLAKTSTLINPKLLSVFVRFLHHVKLVYQPGKPLEAKAYLWFGHLWLTPAEFQTMANKFELNLNL